MHKVFVAAVILLLVVPFSAYADIPHLISYQGRLTDDTGVPVPDGSYDLTFTIYDDSTSGTVLWSEVHSVTTESGLFDAQLGSMSLLDDSIFAWSPDLFMGLLLSGSATELSPRTRVTSSAFSFRALHADTADYARAAPAGGGAWTEDGNIVRLTDASDSVGIGTSTPSAKLHIVGDAVIVGKTTFGTNHVNEGDHSTISGGSSHGVWEYASTIGGGVDNAAYTDYSTIGGGLSNRAGGLGTSATVAGGENNRAVSNWTTAAGGNSNTAFGEGASIGGGGWNHAYGVYSVVSGGGSSVNTDSNSARGDYSTISGGYANVAEGESSTIGGGSDNSTGLDYSTVSGGHYNDANGGYSTVAGGYSNEAINIHTTVGGGQGNTAGNQASTVAGGNSNKAMGSWATVGGGIRNHAYGSYSVIAGGGGFHFGDSNYTVGSYSTIPGGTRNGAVGDYSFAAGRRAKANHDGTFVWADHTDADFTSTGADQLLIRASGGVGIGNNNPAAALDVAGDIIVTGSTSGRLLSFTNNAIPTNPGQMVNFECTSNLGMNNDAMQIIIGATSSNSSQFIECERGTDIEFRVWGDGDVTADGAITGGGADFAEMVAVSGDVNSVEPGDVLKIDPSSIRSLSKSNTARSTLVAGVYSTSPGFVASEHDWDQMEMKRVGANELSDEMPAMDVRELAAEIGEIPLAVVGIVPCKVTAENGAITPGDLLVSANLPGHAMKDENPKVGTVLGKALEPLSSGTGVIKILLTLQ